MFITGRNSWNHFGSNINEKLIRETADAIVSSGLVAAGYQYGLFIRFCSFSYSVVYFVHS